jgi:hypothetical protein
LAKQHDDWIRSFGVDPNDYLINPDAAKPPAGVDGAARLAKLGEQLDELAAQSARLKQSGIGGKYLDMTIATLRQRLAAVSKDPKHPPARKLEVLEVDVRTELVDASQDAMAQMLSVTKGSTRAVENLLAGAAAQIGRIEPPPDPKDANGLPARLVRLTADLDAAKKIDDPAGLKAAIAAVDAAVQALLQEAIEVRGAGGNDAAKAAIDLEAQEIYRDALQSKYGIVVDDPKLTTKTTHLHEAYAALELVPVDNVVQDRLTNLAFNKNMTTPDGVYGTPVKNAIIIGQFQKDAGIWPYLEPEPDTHPPPKGGSIRQERMSAVVLHELGHSVETRWNPMPDPGRADCGGWAYLDAAKAAAMLTRDFLGANSAVPAALSAAIEKAALATFGSKKADVPAEIAATPHAAAVGAFLTEARGLLCDKNPWDRDKPKQIDTSCIHEAYPGEWVTYLHGQRFGGGMTVSKYQWRAPGEWFAELYAFSYTQQRTPPRTVNKTAAAYMFQG